MKASCSGLLCCGTDPFQKEETSHIVDDIGQPDPHGGPYDTDSSDE
ncbi:hypothetical protein APS_2565 [Acetobacter pasteurianus subsp. pasteurianus LMG 1262 = NBRC 106471]|uniref:Uncharacterized protein n=1 Tax=Acetobacter pasteurianus TaxID=438 RepID=A0A1A0DNE9_ACEPA|nr:hypothetical protein SRCM100623_00181 [Acetobacter pasteurianus]GAB31963.1 hypothetical protein APS_2565 [Acetobacter pasteurianus subsp. pasteurianus LMG 1262 = NBRC 106471]GCD51107.1 hypothetical protein NBRC106471_2663 [Acetobacter pasteurianus subsp. pasteurianus LMG 1262 = NBRC 106471]